MFCSTCGTENEDTAQTCESCGAALVRPEPAVGAPPPDAPADGASSMDPSQERTWGMLCHLLAFSGFIVPSGNVIGPLVMWLIKKDESAYVDYHGKESVNFEISVLIYGLVCVVLAFVVIGIVLGLALWIFWIVVVIQACIAASNGQYYRYPMSIRFIK